MAARVARPRWKDADTADFIRCWNEGMRAERLAARFLCSPGGVVQRAKALRKAGHALTRRKSGPRL